MEYNALYSIFKRAKTHPEKLQATRRLDRTPLSCHWQVMSALGSTQHAGLKMRTLRWALSEDIKLQDIMYPVMGVASSGAEGIDMCWKWFQVHKAPRVGILGSFAHRS